MKNKMKIIITKMIGLFKQIDYKTWYSNKYLLILVASLSLIILIIKLLTINIFLSLIVLVLTLLYHKIFDKYIDNQNIFIRYILSFISLIIIITIK